MGDLEPPTVLSRVEDRPAATILHARFPFFWFLVQFLKQSTRPKYAPPRRTNYTLKWKGSEAAPPIYFIFTLLGGAYFGQIFCLKTQAKTKQIRNLYKNTQIYIYIYKHIIYLCTVRMFLHMFVYFVYVSILSCSSWSISHSWH